jgi:hypothetical protein
VIEAVQTVIEVLALVSTPVVGWYAIRAVYGQDRETTFLQRLFVAALALRVAVAIGTYVVLPYGYLAPDEVGYVSTATVMMKGGHVDLALLVNGEGWQYFNVLLFHFAGINPLLPRLWNCVVGAVTPVVCFSLARTLGARTAAKWSAVLVAAFPSLVLWSTLNLKDVDVWLLVLGGLLLTIRLQAGLSARNVVPLLLVVTILEPLRRYTDIALLAAAVVSLLVLFLRRSGLTSRRGYAPVVAGVLAVLAGLFVVVVVILPVGEWVYRSAGLARIASLRANFAVGAHSAVDPAPGLETLHGALAFLPAGLVDFLLRPFPWEHGSATLMGTRPEMVLYYGLLLLAVIGIVYSLRAHPTQTLPALVFLIVAAVGYALVLGNLGTIYRERDQLIIVIFAFVGVGLYAAELVRSRRHGGRHKPMDLPQSA